MRDLLLSAKYLFGAAIAAWAWAAVVPGGYCRCAPSLDRWPPGSDSFHRAPGVGRGMGGSGWQRETNVWRIVTNLARGAMRLRKAVSGDCPT